MEDYDPSRIIQDEEEFLDDVAAFHEQRGYAVHIDYRTGSLISPVPISTAMARYPADRSPFTSCTSL